MDAGTFSPCLAVLALAAARAVVAQMEGRALGLVTAGHGGIAATHLDLVEGAVILVAAVVSAACDGTLDGLVCIVLIVVHVNFTPFTTLSMSLAAKLIHSFAARIE